MIYTVQHNKLILNGQVRLSIIKMYNYSYTNKYLNYAYKS